MFTGFASGCPTDKHEEMLLGFIPSYETGNSARVFLPIRPAVGCGNQFWVLGADETIQRIVYIAEGSKQIISVMVDPLRTQHSVFAEPNGQWSTIGGIDIFAPTFELTSTNGRSVNVQFPAVSEILETYGDSGQLTNWDLTGLVRYSTLRPSTLRITEAELDVKISTDGGTHFVTLELNGIVLSQGSVVGSGTVYLFEVNESGVSGTVDLYYAFDVPGYLLTDVEGYVTDSSGEYVTGSNP